MKENRVDLNQQRHHSEAQIAAGRHSQTEAREHLREEFESTKKHRNMQHNMITDGTLKFMTSFLVIKSTVNN